MITVSMQDYFGCTFDCSMSAADLSETDSTPWRELHYHVTSHLIPISMQLKIHGSTSQQRLGWCCSLTFIDILGPSEGRLLTIQRGLQDASNRTNPLVET